MKNTNPCRLLANLCRVLATGIVCSMMAACGVDKVRLSTSYGAAPVFLSIIPGVGQWYKGSKV